MSFCRSIPFQASASERIQEEQSTIRRSAFILEEYRSIAAGPEVEQKRIHSHSLCQNHRGLVIHSTVSRALDAQLFRPWSLGGRRAVLGLLKCDFAKLYSRRYCVQTRNWHRLKEGERAWAAQHDRYWRVMYARTLHVRARANPTQSPCAS